MQTKLACVLLLAVVGCKKDDPYFCRDNPTASGCMSMGIDGALIDGTEIDMDPNIDARLCFGSDAYSICLTNPPSAPQTLTGAFDTSPGNTKCLSVQPADWAATQPQSCIVVGTTVTVTNLDVEGTRPLVLLAATTITINGSLDAASHLSGTKSGPGEPGSLCGPYTDTPVSSNSGSGGGAGGTFLSLGADGGLGDSVALSNGTAVALGTAPTVLAAGCRGQSGGSGEGTGGAGGRGGGAVYLIAGTQLVLTDNSIINASGGAASKAGRSAGGGGGGTGGMIVLDAATTVVGSNAFVVANGGGGSSGGNDTGGCGCNAGGEPSPATPTTAAAGGTGGGGNGGNGFAEGTVPGPGIDNSEGGGGGGGGAGYILTRSVLGTAGVSPTPVML